MTIREKIEFILKAMAEERGCHCCRERYDCPDAVRDPDFLAGEDCPRFDADGDVTNEDVDNWIAGD